MGNNRVWGRLILTTALASGLLFAVGTASARPDSADDCHRRLEADRSKVDRDAGRFGNDSRQVSRDVARMDTDRQWCRDHKADYDHSRFDVGIYLHK
jgi:hypothetical protein